MQETQQVPPAAYTVREFCDAHRFTPKFFYDLQKRGIGPKIMKVGTRTLISVEAANEWRRDREANAELMEPRRGRRATPLPRECQTKRPADWRERIKTAGVAGKDGPR